MPKVGKINYRIGRKSIFLMLFVAGMLDLLGSIIDIAGGVVLGSWIAYILFLLIFGFWFYLKGIPLISLRRILTYITTLIIEYLPALSFLPGIFAAVLVVIIITRTEDRTGISIPTSPNKISSSPLSPSSK